MPVTLRIRLVLGLLALLTVGLVLFGVATYSFYSRSQYDRLDEQVRASQPLVSRDLDQAAGRRCPLLRGRGADVCHGSEPPSLASPVYLVKARQKDYCAPTTMLTMLKKPGIE